MNPGPATDNAVLRGSSVSATSSQAAAATYAATPPGPIIGALGFASAEAYQAYLDTLTASELQVHLLLVLHIAQNIEAGPTP